MTKVSSEASSHTQPTLHLSEQRPEWATAALVLETGEVLWGRGLGASGHAVGELCFNTALTGYQEIITDPSYAEQIITFTMPHIGNVGVNDLDVEHPRPACKGVVLREEPSDASNYRAESPLNAWLRAEGVVGINAIDTRALTARLRSGALRAVVAHSPEGAFDLPALLDACRSWSG